MYEIEDSVPSSPAENIDTRSIFQELLGLKIRNLRDLDGRPLREQMASHPHEPLLTEFRRCPYPGTRHHHEKLMNVSALKQITSYWADVMGSIGEIHNETRKHMNGPLTHFGLWRIVNTGVLFPSYVALRARDPFGDGELPVWIAGVYKVLIGIHTTVRPLMFQSLLKGEPVEPIPTAQEMYDYVEEIKGLVGAREVCAGPPALILRALDVVLTGRPDEDAQTERFHETVERPASLVEFAELALNLFILNFAFVARMRQNASRLKARLRQAQEQGMANGAATDLVQRVENLIEEQLKTPVGRLSRRAETTEGVDMNRVTTALANKVGRPRPEYQGLNRKVGASPVSSLEQLIQEELDDYQTLENAFLADATEISRLSLESLGHKADSQKVLREDFIETSGQTLGNLLEESQRVAQVA